MRGSSSGLAQPLERGVLSHRAKASALVPGLHHVDPPIRPGQALTRDFSASFLSLYLFVCGYSNRVARFQLEGSGSWNAPALPLHRHFADILRVWDHYNSKQFVGVLTPLLTDPQFR